MIRNLKILGLAVVALCAFATSAQAATFHSEVSPTRLTIHSDGEEGSATAHHVINVSGSPLTCRGIEGSGTFEGVEREQVAIEPIYRNCTFLGVTVTVNMNACEYVLNANGNVFIGSKAGKNCETEPITYNASGLCTVKIGPQTLTGIKYHPSGEEITLEMSVAGISGTKSGGFCPGGPGPFKTGEYTTGNTLVTGETDSGAAVMKKLWVE